MTTAVLIASTPSKPLPRTGARQALAAAIDQLAAAQMAAARAAEPAQRLQAPIDGLARLDRELAALDIELSAEVGAWISAGSIGERPAVSDAAVGLRQRRAALAADAEAAALALPAAQARHIEAIEMVRMAARRRDEALAIAAGEAAQEMSPKMAAALSEFLRLQGILIGLRVAMTEAGNGRGASPLWLGHAAAISDAIDKIKRATTMIADPEPGRRLLDRLAHDASATL